VSEHDALLEANDRYAARFAQGELSHRPGRRFAVLTCMDCRLDPAKALGLDEGDAHVIRNAGGVATDDALRSIVISHWLLGTREVFVIGHTECGLASLDEGQLRERLAQEAGASSEWLELHPFEDEEAIVRTSLLRLRASDLLPDDYGVTGFLYDVRTGKLREVLA
jgi:carbonic anhydrase